MNTSLFSALGVAAGAASGAVLRWLLGVWLNTLHPALPVGTLAANWLGAFAIGLLGGFFADTPSVSPFWRLFFITGMLGGLTTFSTFSWEAVSLLNQRHFLWAALHIGLHLGGSLCLAALGMWTWHLVKAA